MAVGSTAEKCGVVGDEERAIIDALNALRRTKHGVHHRRDRADQR